MSNPIPTNNLFTTPDDMAHLIEIVEGMDNVAQAYQVLMFTMNYCHKMVEHDRAVNAE
jgi:hypothetical protein